MVFFSLYEVFQVLVISAALGFIFRDLFKKPRDYENYDPIRDYKRKRFKIEDFLFAAAVVAPGIILHELGHKFTALALGASASFHASYAGLALGIILKTINFPFVFFVPAYVMVSTSSYLHHSFIALAGPLVNLAVFFIVGFVLKHRQFKRNTHVALLLTKRLNLFFFIFNMIPFPGFDGYHWLTYLIKGLSGQ